MPIAFSITLIIVILVSLIFTFDAKGTKDSKVNAGLLCVFGIVAYIVSSIVL